MMPETWVNGQPAKEVLACDRGLHYGDGFFTTALIGHGTLLNAQAHWQRLQASAQRLHFIQFSLSEVQRQVKQCVAETQPELAVLKILVTRGCGGRGYAPPVEEKNTVVIQLLPFPLEMDLQAFWAWLVHKPVIEAPVLQSKWGCHAQLAGVKHLNRLENVLARQELQQWENLKVLEEGVMLNENAEVISGTQSNLVASISGRWVTPKLHHSGVMGTTLRRLSAGMEIAASTLSLQTLQQAEALFFCNAVRGVIPVRRLILNAEQAVDFSIEKVLPVQRYWRDCLQKDLIGSKGSCA